MKIQELLLEDPRRINALVHRLAHLLSELATIEDEMHNAFQNASGNNFVDVVRSGAEVCQQNGLARKEFEQLIVKDNEHLVDPDCLVAIQKILIDRSRWDDDGGERLHLLFRKVYGNNRPWYYTEFTKKHVWYMLYAEIYKITHELCRFGQGLLH
jgi:hypothetical protein